MSVKVWSIGVAIIVAFILGSSTEAGNGGGGELTTSQIVALIVLGAWSIGVWLVSVGYSEGKRER